MKINEVFEGLTEDKDRVYQTNSCGSRFEMSISDGGFMTFKAFRESGELIDSSKGAGGFTGNLEIDNKWELVRKPVTFMEAVNSGKRFKPESWKWNVNNDFRNLYDNLSMFSGRQGVQVEILNGKWIIE